MLKLGFAHPRGLLGVLVLALQDDRADRRGVGREFEGRVKVAKVDVDANPVTPGMFGIMSIPTLMIFKGGKAEERVSATSQAIARGQAPGRSRRRLTRSDAE